MSVLNKSARSSINGAVINLEDGASDRGESELQSECVDIYLC